MTRIMNIRLLCLCLALSILDVTSVWANEQTNRPTVSHQNLSTIQQIGQLIDPSNRTFGNRIEITQVGSDNRMVFTQTSENNTLIANQSGGNEANVIQTGVGGSIPEFNWAQITQGMNNRIALRQRSLQLNVATVIQDGHRNRLLGSSLSGEALQEANGDNVLEAVQRGDDNQLGLTQKGEGSVSAFLTQDGNGNRMGIEQNTAGFNGHTALSASQYGDGLHFESGQFNIGGAHSIEIIQFEFGRLDLVANGVVVTPIFTD